MLPAYIIEQLRRREQARREDDPQPRLELPLPVRPASKDEDATEERGVVIIHLMR